MAQTIWDSASASSNQYGVTLASNSTRALTVPANSVLAYLQAEGADVRYTDDGSAPTATVGMLLKSGAMPFPYPGPASSLKFIGATTGGTLNASYHKPGRVDRVLQ